MLSTETSKPPSHNFVLIYLHHSDKIDFKFNCECHCFKDTITIGHDTQTVANCSYSERTTFAFNPFGATRRDSRLRNKVKVKGLGSNSSYLAGF